MVTWLLRCYIKPNWQGDAVVSFSGCLARMVQEAVFLKNETSGSCRKASHSLPRKPSAISSIMFVYFKNCTLKLAYICNISEY